MTLDDPYQGRIPILASHSTNILNFRKQLVKMHGYYNVLRDTDNTIMDQGVKNSFEQRYNNINNTVVADSDALYDSENADELKTKYNELLSFNEELRAVTDRYAFFRLLNDVRTREVELNDKKEIVNRPYGPGGGSIGYDSFGSSEYVTADIEAGHDGTRDSQFSFEIDEFGPGELNREPLFEAPNGEVFCFGQVIAKNTYDQRRDSTTIPAIGTRRMGFHFTCGTSRWMQWKVITRTMRFTQKLYPFNFSGLNR